jgi:CopA family copper-resistance protein
MKTRAATQLNRRRLLRRSLIGAGGFLAARAALPVWALGDLTGLRAEPGNTFDLVVSESRHAAGGRVGRAILVNDELPAPLLRWREGERVTLNVINRLSEPTSIHWHGLLLPMEMDGVPGVSFPGIPPGETFTYHFPVRQAGTYWYHSHSGLQEQLGHYGPIIIEPAEPDPVAFDREFVVVLSDWSFVDPHRIAARLGKMSDLYNQQQRTLPDFVADARQQGWSSAWSERTMWGRMRMNPTDISDVTAAVYTYLINGSSSAENWTGLFRPGERLRLRFINAAAMTLFNVRIPGLPMTVVQADGINIQPVQTDEFQIGTAETYDVLIEPDADTYALIAESIDRSGQVRGTLSTDAEAIAPIPVLRERPTLTMKDMAHNPAINSDNQAMVDHAHHHGAQISADQPHNHPTGAGVAALAAYPVSRLADRPIGLEAVEHRVLTYADLKSLQPNPDQRLPERELELHLTGNMERYMWSFDGRRFSEVEAPIRFYLHERLRLTLVNDTMMNHPIHQHGMFFDLVNGQDSNKPRKHTIVVKPGEKLSMDVTAEAPGDWAFHCHLLYHMHAGMMQVVSVRRRVGDLS